MTSNVDSSSSSGSAGVGHHLWPLEPTGHFVLKCIGKFVKVAPQAEQRGLVSAARFHFPPVVLTGAAPPDIDKQPPPPLLNSHTSSLHTRCRPRVQISPQGVQQKQNNFLCNIVGSQQQQQQQQQHQHEFGQQLQQQQQQLSRSSNSVDTSALITSRFCLTTKGGAANELSPYLKDHHQQQLAASHHYTGVGGVPTSCAPHLGGPGAEPCCSPSFQTQQSVHSHHAHHHHHHHHHQYQNHHHLHQNSNNSNNSNSIHQQHDTESDEDEIALYPLNNQVGGHTRLLLLNQSTVIKPLNLRELEFYQNIPSDIQQFVPKYRGVMQATTMGGTKLEKRYSPSFRDDPGRKTAASKRKREEVLR